MRVRFVAHRRFETLAGSAGAALAQPAENDLRRGASVVGDKRALFGAGLEHPDSQEEREPFTFETPPGAARRLKTGTRVTLREADRVSKTVARAP